MATAPDSALSYKTLGYVYLRAGRLLQAREALEKALRLSPFDERALQQLSEVYYAQGDYARAEMESARQHARRALELEPYSQESREVLRAIENRLAD